MTTSELRHIERAVEMGQLPRNVEVEVRKLIRHSKQLRGQIRAARAIYENERDPARRAQAMWLCLKEQDDGDHL